MASGRVCILALFVGLCAMVYGQNLPPVNAPPNCDCAAFDAAETAMRNAMQGMMGSLAAFFPGGANGQFGGPAGQQPGFGGQQFGQNAQGGRPAFGQGPVGGRPPMMPPMAVCGNDGRNYTNQCQLENAKANNRNLGWRPCDVTGDLSRMGQMMTNSPMRDMAKVVCLTTGQAVNATMPTIMQFFAANPTVGVRCQGNCPCSLTCPSTGPDGKM